MPPIADSDCRLTFGLSADGHLVRVVDAENGIGCGLVCPGCHGRLIAAQGPINAWHFRHESEDACASGYETMAHLLAKEIIAEEKKLLLSPSLAHYQNLAKHVREWVTADLQDIQIEAKMGDSTPDVLATFAGAPIAIEVVVTHPCWPDKIAKLRRDGIATLEIDLSSFRRGLEETSFRTAVLRSAYRFWVFDPLIEPAIQRLKDEWQENRRSLARKRALDEAREEERHLRSIRNAAARSPTSEVEPDLTIKLGDEILLNADRLYAAAYRKFKSPVAVQKWVTTGNNHLGGFTPRDAVLNDWFTFPATLKALDYV